VTSEERQKEFLKKANEAEETGREMQRQAAA
jgi:hypothetical protein